VAVSASLPPLSNHGGSAVAALDGQCYLAPPAGRCNTGVNLHVKGHRSMFASIRCQFSVAAQPVPPSSTSALEVQEGHWHVGGVWLPVLRPLACPFSLSDPPHPSFRPRTPSSFSFQMSSETSSPRSLTPLQPSQFDSLDDVQNTPFSFLYDGRLPFRVRPRQMILLFAVAITTLILFSQRSLFLESSLDYRPPVSSPFAAVQATEPVVFALIMYSEDSAREGAVLLKVSARLGLMSRLGNRIPHIVRHNVY
jgi:hypothetical protein